MRIPVLLTAFFVVILTILGVGYFALPTIATGVANHYLSRAGFDGASLTIESIGLTRAEIVKLDLGLKASFNAERVTIDYSPARLSEGFIDGVIFEAPDLGLKVDPSGISLGALDQFLETSDQADSTSTLAIVGPVSVIAGRLLVSTPVGTVAASVDGDVLLTDGLGTKFNSAISLDHEKAQLSGRLSGFIDDSDQVRLDIEIENARSEARLAFSEMVGAVTVEGTLASAFDGGGSLTMQDVSFDGLPIGNMDLAGTLDGTSAHAELLLAGDGTGLTLQTKVDMPNVFDANAPVRVGGEIATDGLRGAFALPGDIGLIGAATFLLEASQADIRALPAYFANGRQLPNKGITGIVDAELISIEMPEERISLTLDGATTFLIDNRSIQARAVDTLDLNATIATENKDYALRASVSPIDNVPFIAVGPSVQQPIDVGMTFKGELEGFGALSGSLGGNLWAGDEEGLAFENFSIQLNPWRTRVAGLDLSFARLVAKLAGQVSKPTIGLAGEVLFAGTPTQDVSINGGGISFATRLQFEGQEIGLYSEACPEIRLGALKVSNATVQPGRITLCPLAETTPLLSITTEKGHPKRIDGAGILSSVELQLDGVGPYPVAGVLPRMETQASYSLKDGTWWSRLLGTGGDLALEGPDVSIAGLIATLELEGKTRLLGARIDVSEAKVVDKRRPLRFEPVQISGKASTGSDKMDFAARVAIPDGPAAEARGRHRHTDGRGSVTLTLPRWYAEPGNVVVSQAFPILKGIVTDVTGGVEAEARWDWTARGMRSTATVQIENGAFASLPVEVRGINGTLNLIDVLTPQTDGVQEFSLGLVDAGFPLNDGKVSFTLPGDGSVLVENISWPFAGGRLGADNIVVPFGGMPDQATANISGIDATELVNLADVADLEAEGSLNGYVPVRFSEDGVIIDDAKLSSIGGGILRYRSASAVESLKQSGGSSEILARALEDFRFDDLEIRLDGPLDGEIIAKAQINGANPALYDGKRIELNVSLQGALREFLQSANVIRNIPETIRDRVQGPTGNQ